MSGLGSFVAVISLLALSLAILGLLGLIRIAHRNRLHLERRVAELATLNRVGQAITANLSLDDLLETIYAQVQTLCQISSFYIALYDSTLDRITFPFVRHQDQSLDWPDHQEADGLTEYLIRTRQPLLLPDRVRDRLAELGVQGIGPVPACYLGIPMIVRDEVVGVLALQHGEQENVYSQQDCELLSTVAAQAATALQNALIYRSTDASLHDRVIELSTIEVVSRQITATLDPEQIINDVLAAVMSAIDASIGNCVLETAPGRFALVTRLDARGTPLDVPFIDNIQDGVVGRVLRTRQPAVVADVLEDPDYISLTPGTRSELCVPIIFEGGPIGALDFEDPRVDAFTESNVRLVTTLAEHLAIAIQNARLFTDRRRQLETLMSLRKFSLELLSALDIMSVVEAAVEWVQSITHARTVSLYLRQRPDENLTRIASRGESAPGIQHETYRENVARTGESYYSADVPPPSAYPHFPQPDFEMVACIPLQRAGLVPGVLEVVFQDPYYCTQNEIQALGVLADQLGVAIENARLYEEVRASRDQMQAILESTREGMLLFDRHGRLLRINPAAESILEQSLTPYVGHHFLRWLRTVDSEQAEALIGFSLREVHHYVKSVLRDPARETHRQFRRVRGGEIRYLYETGLPVLDHQRQSIGWLLVWRDVTEERKLDDLRQELSSMIVHDLRNPITSIISSLTMLRDMLAVGDIDQNLFAEVIDIALSSGDSMLNLVQSLLDIARLEQDLVTLDCELAPLGAVVDAASAAVFSLVMAADIALTIALPDGLPPVWIDGEKIQRVLVNLLDNALRYTPVGGEIRIEAELRQAEVLVRVSDTGPGIPPEARGHIFDKFTQLDRGPVRGHKGSGLGLTFCKLVVEGHGGNIWVEGRPAGGALFCFTLPTAPGRKLASE
jgi:PAS domain S-box-containing protein